MPDRKRLADASRPPEPHYQPLVIVLAAVVAGILADRNWPLPVAVWFAAAGIGLGTWLLVSAIRNHWQALSGVLLLMAVATTAAAWRHCCWRLFEADDLGRYARQAAEPVCVEGVVVTSPRALPPGVSFSAREDVAAERTRLTFDLIALRNGGQWQPLSGRATLLVLGKPSAVEAGDCIRCFARLSAPDGPQNPGAFDYAARLRSERVLCRLMAERPECVTVVRRGSEWNLSRQLEQVRLHGNRMLERYLDPRRAELAAAVLLGYREELDADRNEAFLTTGTVHILSISGLHVGILAGVLFWIARRTRLRRGLALAAVAAITLLYAMMVDVEPPVVRATILVLVTCAAAWLGRSALGFNSLAAAALIVLALNPDHLFHVGAQLSFLCMAGLIWVASRRLREDDPQTKIKATLRRLEWQNLGWLSQTRRKIGRGFAGAALAGLTLWALTLPLVLARFHVLSFVALGLNVLLWPVMSLSLVSGFGVMLLGTICPPLGHACGWLCDGSFWLLEEGISSAHHVPGGHCWRAGPADWWLWGYYGALAFALTAPRLCPRRRWWVTLLGLWIALGLAVSAWRHDRSQLDCTFLSVGHGNAAFIKFPNGQTMLCDAGHMGEPASGARIISQFLWDRGLSHLDAIVLSHADSDHYNAVPGLLEKFSVGAIYVSPVMFEKGNTGVEALHETIQRHKVPIRVVRAGDQLDVGDDCTAKVLHPPRNGVLGRDNANSLVLAVEYRGRRIMLPGDLESPGLDDLLAEKPWRCDVLMAPHHCTRTT